MSNWFGTRIEDNKTGISIDEICGSALIIDTIIKKETEILGISGHIVLGGFS